MDLSFLIPSKTRRLVLAYFVENPESQVGIREFARELRLSPQVLYRELLNLENWGFLFSSKRGNQRVFRLNRKLPFYPPIRDLLTLDREEQNRRYQVDRVYKMEDLVREINKVKTPPEMIPILKTRRKRPRSYAEEKLLKQYGQL